MAHEHLLHGTPIERKFEYRGEEITVYFRPLTAGERMQMKKGQKGNVKAGEASFEVDLGDVDARNMLLLSFAQCTEDGKAKYRGVHDVYKLPAAYVDKLLEACGEALKDDESGN